MSDVDIIARLKLNGEQFSSEFKGRMDKVEADARSASARIGAAFDGLRTVGATIAGLVGGAALVGAADRALEYASSLGEISQQLGVTTHDLQVYRYVASQTGVDQDTMDRSLAKLTVTMGKARDGAKEPTAAFQALGISIEDLRGATAGDLLPKIADGLAGIASPAKRAQIEVALFSKAGQALEPALAGGSAALREMAENAEHLGLVLEDRLLTQADDAADKVSTLKQVLQIKIAGAVAENVGAINTLADALIRVAVASGKAVTGLVNVNQLARANNADLPRTDRNQAVNNLLLTPAGRRAYYEDQHQRRERDIASYNATTDGSPAAKAAFQKRMSYYDLAFARIINASAPVAKSLPKQKIDGDDGTGAGIVSHATPKDKGGATGKSDSQREAEAAVKAQERLGKALDEQIAAADRALGIERLRASGLERQADIEEAIAGIRDRYPEIAGRTVEQVVATLKISKEQAQLDIDRVQHLQDQAVAAATVRSDAADREEATRAQKQRDEEAARALEQAREQARRDQEDDIRSLADLYQSAFEGGTGSIWKTFKREGEAVIAEIAARYTLALIAGQKPSLAGIAASSRGSGSPLDSLLGATKFLGIGGGSDASIIAKSGTLSTLAKGGSVLGAGASAAPAAGLLGGAGAALSAAAPYLAVASVALPLISGLLKGHKTGKANITTGADAFNVSLAGNSSSRKSTASSGASSIEDAVRAIAEQLGGSVQSGGSVSFGVRDGNFRVDPTGAGNTKLKKGAIDFGKDQEAAIQYAVSDLLKDGVIAGISDASKRLLASGGDIDAQVAKALKIEGLKSSLQQRLDPVGYAVDQVTKKFIDLVAVLDESGASAEQRADAEKLYKLELEDAKATSGGAKTALQDFLKALNIGSSSPLSLRDQEASAKAMLQPFLDSIGKGAAVDNEKYQAAAQSFLDVERELYGSTSQYFDAFNSIQDATNKAIASIDAVTPIRGATVDPFAEKTATATQATAEIGAQTNGLLQENNTLLRQLVAAAGVTPSDFIGAGRNFVNAA